MAVSKQHNEMEISEMIPSKAATIHGVVVGNLSPVKTSRKRADVQFFEGNLTDGKKVARLISFEPNLRGEIDQMRQSGQSVKLSNCSVQQSKLSGSDLEVVLNKRTNLCKSPNKYTIDEGFVTTSIDAVDVPTVNELTKVSTNQRVNVIGKVISLKVPEKVYVKSRNEDVMKQDFVFADSTATCRGVIWNKTDLLKCNSTYNFINLTVCSFKGKYLSVSSNSVINEIDDIGEVREEEDPPLSDDEKQVYGEIIGAKCEDYYRCLTCKAKVIVTTPMTGECSNCSMKVKLSKCKQTTFARLLIQDDQGTELKATIFDNVLNDLVPNVDDMNIEDELLSISKVIKFTITSADVVSSVEI